ncbi:LacI family DNA-binding transcriptional regulator [Arthrobacter pityocampae]|uniref:LacI family DNA-binding transcriptional regulator n=1 Tax=Arthrobacter pityocampae TaxID=547334 RepID=UPI003737070B
MTKTTLVSLADSLGVSRQTISNVINAPHRVKPETRARVEAAISASGYRPSAAARQLRTRRSMNLGLRLMPVHDGINGSILDRFLHALTETAQRDGYRLTLFCADSDADEIHQYEELLQVSDIDGFVLTGTHHGDQRTAWLLDHDVPFAAFGRPWNDAEDPRRSRHAWVDVDGGAGTAEATAAFLDDGHESIGFLGWPAGSGAGDDRRAGWQRILAAAGVAPGRIQELTASIDDGVQTGAVAARHLIAAGATAIVCVSDSLALGAAMELRRAFPGVPAAVTGFDDTPVAAAVGLSSVAQPIEAAARHAVAVLTHQLAETTTGGAGVPAPEQHLLLPATLVRRTPYPLDTGTLTAGTP